MTSVVRTPALSLERFDHVPGVAHHDPAEEHAASHALSFVTSGSFRVAVGGTWYEVTANHLFVTTPGLPYACRHDDEVPEDRCLVVRFSEAAIESLLVAGAPRASGAVLPLTNRRAYLRLALEDGHADPARTEALAGALYGTLSPTPDPPRPRFRSHQIRWYAERLRRAKELIASQYAEPLSLSRLAREAGMSVYHFARVFEELEGQAPHRHLVAVRLAAAVARLRAGDSVTATCHAVGFGSLSHFVATFRRHLGMRPGEVGSATS